MPEDTSKYGSQLEEHPNWKGGRTVTSHGYVLVKAPDHPDADTRGYVYEHRLVAEQKLGRRLESDEHVHHKNEDRQDNRWENLEVLHETEHLSRRHSSPDLRKPGEENPVVECACGCGETFEKYDEWGRPRERVPGHTEYALSTPAKDDILGVLRESGPLHRSNIAERVERSLNVVSSHLSELKNEGAVCRHGEGVWGLAEEELKSDGGLQRPLAAFEENGGEASLDGLVPDEWHTVIEREERNDNRLVSGGERA